MQRATTWLVVTVFGIGLSACGSSNSNDQPTVMGVLPATATTVPATATTVPATATSVPSLTATVGDPTVTLTPTRVPSATNPPTATATSVSSATSVPTATAAAPTASPTVTLTATITVTPIPTATSKPAPPVALFNADVTDPNNPFPSDRLLDATGHVALPVAYLAASLPGTKYNSARSVAVKTAAQLAALDGFGTFTPIRIHFSRPVVVDSGGYPKGVMILEYNDLAARPAQITATAYEPDASIELQPVVPLKPKTTYAVVVTTDITDVDGQPVKLSPDFAKLLAGTDLSPDQAAWRAKLLPVITFVNDAFSIDTTGLALVDIFTTQHTTDDLVAIQRRLSTGDLVPGSPVFENSPIKGLQTGIFPEGTQPFRDLIGSYTSDIVSAVAIGVFDSYDFRTGSDGHFDPGYVNGPDIPPVKNHLDFYMTIPKAPMPPNGFPIAIYGHTLGGDGSEVGLISTLNTPIPIVAIAISDVDFGRRSTSFLKFFVFDNTATLRENFRQTVADYLQETKMVQNAHAAGTPPFDIIDPEHIIYLGASLGGIMGGMYMAVEPDVKIGMLSVPGGGLTNILDTPEIGSLLGPLLSLATGVNTNDPYYPQFYHGFRQTAQWAIDAGDPINYAPYIVTPGNQLCIQTSGDQCSLPVPQKHVLVQEGYVDTVVGNRATTAWPCACPTSRFPWLERPQ